MDEKGLAILRQIMSDVEGAPSPGVMKDELYSIWFEHAQSVAQAALEYLNTSALIVDRAARAMITSRHDSARRKPWQLRHPRPP